MRREELGEVRCPSGIVLLVDFGALGLWSHSAPPRFPEWMAAQETVAAANACKDFRVDGPDAAVATLLFGVSPGWLYDRPEDFEQRFAAAVQEKGLNAHVHALSERVPHRARIEQALSSERGYGAVPFHGLWAPVIAELPADESLTVFGIRIADGEFAGRWSAIELEVRAGRPVRTERIGDVPVDWARLGFVDADALGQWRHDESTDGKADFVFWGRDAAEVATEVDAPDRGDGIYGWVDLDVQEAARRAAPIEAARQRGDRRFTADFRPHSHHFHLMEQVRSAPTESGTLALGDSVMCGFTTTWGDGVFPVERDLDADGRVVVVRVRLDATGGKNMRDIDERLSSPRANASSRRRGQVRRAAVVGLVILFLVFGAWSVLRRGEDAMQRDFDAIRVRDVRALAARVVAFRDEVGRCPLGHLAAGETVTVLMTHELPTAWPPEAPRRIEGGVLADDLAIVEGRPVELPIDPQRATFDFWPAIQYETDGRRFVLGVSLYHPQNDAQMRGPHWYKYDLVGSCQPGAGPPRAMWAR